MQNTKDVEEQQILHTTEKTIYQQQWNDRYMYSILLTFYHKKL